MVVGRFKKENRLEATQKNPAETFLENMGILLKFGLLITYL